MGIACALKPQTTTKRVRCAGDGEHEDRVSMGKRDEWIGARDCDDGQPCGARHWHACGHDGLETIQAESVAAQLIISWK
jgi:hypothetical protein